MASAASVKKREHEEVSETSSLSVSEKFRGSHLFTIMDYSFTKGRGVGQCILSNKFSVGSRWWQIKFYADGDDATALDCVSIYLVLVSGEGNTRADFKVCLLDQSGEKGTVRDSMGRIFNVNSTWGWRTFMKRDDLEASNFLKEDALSVHCTVIVVHPPKTLSINPISLPASDITSHFRHLLESGRGADVNFSVDGELFSAHKLILGARSSVFSAQFFGSLKDEGSDPIEVLEMKAPIFKVLLHFIYCDDLPELEEFKDSTQSSMYQHLLVAADRYNLDRLKLVCAAHLSKNMSTNTVTSTWALADRHNCPVLKSMCLEFVASLKSLQDVEQTADFQHIKECDPSSIAAFLLYVASSKKEA